VPVKPPDSGATTTTDLMATQQVYSTQTALAGPAPTSQPKPSLTERLGISSEVVTIVEFSVICGILAILAVAGPILITIRRRHRRKP